MAHSRAWSNPHSSGLPCPNRPSKSPLSKFCVPRTVKCAIGRPILHLCALAFPTQPWRPTQSNLHSLNSWPAVQCNEGFCNALDRRGSILTTITASQKPHHSTNPRTAANSSRMPPSRLARRRVAVRRHAISWCPKASVSIVAPPLIPTPPSCYFCCREICGQLKKNRTFRTSAAAPHLRSQEVALVGSRLGQRNAADTEAVECDEY
jgi:hypothetical protein